MYLYENSEVKMPKYTNARNNYDKNDKNKNFVNHKDRKRTQTRREKAFSASSVSGK